MMDLSAKIEPSVNGSQLLFCDASKPFYWSEHDTTKSIEQAKEHNAVGINECNWN